MTDDRFWFNRLIEYWSLPDEDVVEHVKRARVQVVQMGNFGPDFYSLAEDPDVDRPWAGMPLVGVRANLDRAAELIPQVQAAGARVVGQLSMTMYFGDHEHRTGLFGDVWQRMWTPGVLGDAPCASAADGSQQLADGSLRQVEIKGRPYFTYRGCVARPVWRDVLRAMMNKGLDLGLDGFNATHNYEGFCGCDLCADRVRAALEATGRLDERDLRVLFDGQSLADVTDPREPAPEAPAGLRRTFDAVVEQAAAALRKEAFDAVFVDAGRARRPDLLLAQWYHKYGMRVNDERAALPAQLWARGESYIWYSQGPYRWGSSIEQGYIADMGINARHMRAAGGGRPFVINKYDYRRWRVWAGESAAHGGAALAFHAGPPRPGQEDTTRIAPEDYYGPVIRYQRFLAEHEALLHPATPWSQVGVVYPRRGEREFEADYLDVLKRIGEWLEDAHVLYDLLFDDDLGSRAGDFPVLVLADTRRLSADDVKLLRRHVDGGGALLLAAGSGTLDAAGEPWRTDPLLDWRAAPAAGEVLARLPAAPRVLHLPQADWLPVTTPIRTLDDAEMPVYSHLPDDAAGRAVIDALADVSAGLWLHTDAPWSVRVRAWRPVGSRTLVLHWINYRQDEAAAIEVPVPVGPMQVRCRLPVDDGAGGVVHVDSVEWRYPEMKAPEPLPHTVEDGCVVFSIPRLIVYGMSVLQLA